MIRKATAKDFKKMTQIWLEASIDAHNFMPDSFWRSKVHEMQNLYLPSSKNYVYNDGETILGFISVYQKTIAALFVSPASQGKGIGSKLMNFIKSQYSELDLRVYKSNTASLSFYEKHSFVICGEGTDENTGHPEILMKRVPGKPL